MSVSGLSEQTHDQTASVPSASTSYDDTATSGSELSIRAIDAHSVHRITSGQVVIDLQTAVKELVENSVDAGATNIEVRFHNYGLKSIEVIDNGSGIASKDYESIALKHYTSKLASFEDLSRVLTFGFRGEALSSLCALSEGFSVVTATSADAPMGTVLDIDRNGKVRSRTKVARQRGTTVTITNLFKPLPVRRKEFERNTKREFQKALNLLYAYALVPCARENRGVRMTASNVAEGGRKTVQLKTNGAPSTRASVLALWGSKALENIVDLDLSFDVETEKSVLRRQAPDQPSDSTNVTSVKVQGLISKFAVGAGRTTVDRQYFFVNGRPYNPGKVQKAFNEVYRTFNANQSPFVIADFVLPTHACDINVSPDKRTIFLHSENNLIQALKASLEETFAPSRSTYDVSNQSVLPLAQQRIQQQQQQKSETQTQQQIQMRASTGPQHPQHEPTPAPTLAEAQERRGSGAADEDADAGSDGGGGDGDDRKEESNEANGRITMGVPHLLLEQAPEPEPESTLVAQLSKHAGKGKARQMVDRDKTRAPSEPLFFPESDEERRGDGDRGRRAGKRKGGAADEAGDSSEPGKDRTGSSRPPLRATAVTATAAPTNPSTSTSNKPRSVQTVLNTRGAAWNVRRNADEDGDEGRERKRARLAGDGRSAGKKSLRSTLSQFVSGNRVGKNEEEEDEDEDEDEEDEEEIDESEGKGVVERRKTLAKDDAAMEVDSEEEVDELIEDDVPALPRTAKKKRSRAGSTSPQGTVVIPSDDEGAMDVDEPPSATSKSPRVIASHTRSSTSSTTQVPAQDVIDLTEDDWELSSTLVGTYVPPASKKPSTSTSIPAPALRDVGTDCVTLQVDLLRIGSHYLDLYSHLTSSSSQPVPAPTPKSTLRSAVSSANLENAAADSVASAALSRIISKADFKRMQVLGQFNLGFIIVRKRTGGGDGDAGGDAMDDLFIVDQHAADEKWNFETLQEKTVIESQRLFRPRPLQLTAADELLAIDNLEVLKRNGFEVSQVEEGEPISDEHVSSPRLHLIAQPMSKDTVFDMKDLEELIHLMQDRPTGTMVRCSKARAMFAMRACRRSVMVGKALDKSHMTAIVRHMGTMDQPWNCPHGRPTMRHLSDLTSFGRYDPPKRAIDWEAFGMDEPEAEE